MRKLTMIGLTFAALVITTSTASAAPDSWITTKAKLALMTTEGVSGTSINVDTVDGRITLHGKVASEAEKAKAADAARKIDGVKDVRNLLQVTSPKQEDAVAASDDEIKDRVTKALDADKALADSDISVQSVNKGVVLLGGTAKTLSAHERAVHRAARVPGVRRVATEVKSPDTFADSELRQRQDAPKADASAERKDGDYGVADTASDMWITSETKLRLMANSETPAHEINVDTRDGVVTLFGMVPSEQAKRAAETDARKVGGVKTVINELQIVPAPQERMVKQSDDDIERAVEQAIEKRQDLKDASIKVEVSNGIARLSGTVPDDSDRLSAALAARSTLGVRSVLHNDLRVK